MMWGKTNLKSGVVKFDVSIYQTWESDERCYQGASRELKDPAYLKHDLKSGYFHDLILNINFLKYNNAPT